VNTTGSYSPSSSAGISFLKSDADGFPSEAFLSEGNVDVLDVYLQSLDADIARLDAMAEKICVAILDRAV
jgi:hypothetical protein